ncbi:MAG: MotA/TolQ/ExbB proton channel family protein, partial [Enterovibrio sp.]
MDLATLIGLIGGMTFITMAMLLGGTLAMFADLPSVLIVFGGTLFVVLMKFTVGQFFGAFKVAGKAFIFKLDAPEDLIIKLVEMAEVARKGGFLALEEMEFANSFMKKGVDLLVDGHDAEVVRQALYKDISMTEERHDSSIKFYTSIADVAPAMGMIGTLIGLVAMLSNMDDPKSIGPA